MLDDDTQNQINALLGDGNDESVEEGTSETEDSSEETGSEVSEETQESSEGEEHEETSNSEGEKSNDSEEGSENASESSESPEKPEESDGSVSEVDALRAEVNRLAAKINEGSTEESSSSEEKPAIPEPNLDPATLFGDDFDFESVVESEESFKKFLTDFAKKVQGSAHESILQTLPDTVSTYVNQQVTVKEQVNEFYKNNPDLSSTKRYVSVTANEVASEHPDWDFPTVLDETAKRVRKSLGLKEEAKKENSSSSGQKKDSPALAKGTKGQSSKKKPKQELSQMEQEIQELMEE